MLQKFSPDDDFAAFYREYGYVVLANLFDPAQLDEASEAIRDLFAVRFAETNEVGVEGDELLVHFYTAEQEMWRQCAKRMCDLLPVVSLGSDARVVRVLRRLGLEAPLVSTSPEVRTDMPGDARYMQPWHQDWRAGQGSLNAVTVWVPLHRVGAENGAIEIVPRSHRDGLLETRELANPRRFEIDDPRFAARDAVVTSLELGEAVVFSQMLVHRSGVNRSRSPRLTVQLRFADYAERSFANAGFPRPTGSELVWAEAPSARDMDLVFGASR
jgi:phytanoyl-CoA hydroxylase